MSVEIRGLGKVIKDFSNKKNIIQEEKKRLLEKIGNQTSEIGSKFTPVKTGKMKQSWTYKTSTNQVKIWNKAKYYIFVDEGTKSHIVLPKKKTALRFKKGNSFVYSKGHLVKGIKAQKITDKTQDKMMSKVIKQELKVFLKNIAK